MFRSKSLLIIGSALLLSLQAPLQSALSIESSASCQGYGSPLFTNWNQYNELDFAGVPTGIFQTDSMTVSVELGAHSFGFWEKSNLDSLKKHAVSFNAPKITAGAHGVGYIQLHYTPDLIAVYDASGKTKYDLALQRFGLLGAVSMPKGVFQIGVAAEGFYGVETQNKSDSTRLIMGFKTLKGSIGSRVHELVGIGMEGGVTGRLDTLKIATNSNWQDRYFEGSLPMLGWFIDFGYPGFPVQSDFILSTATNRLIYVYKFNTGEIGNRPPVIGDSLSWHWKTLGTIPINGIIYHPGVALDFQRCNNQLYFPKGENNTLEVGAKQVGKNWAIKNLSFGIGGSAEILSYGSTYFEFSHSKISLDVDSAYGPTFKDTSRGYERVLIGAQGNIHAIKALRIPSSIGIFGRLSYENLRINSLYDGYRSDEFSLNTPLIPNSLGSTPLYAPAPGADQRIGNFTVGLGASFFSNQVRLDAAYSMLTKKESSISYKGYGFALDLGYEIR